MKDFFRQVLPSCGWYFLATPSNAGPSWTHHAFRELDAMVADVGSLAKQKRDVYFACASYKADQYKDDTGKTRRRTADNAAWAKSFWLDIDCGEDKATVGNGYRDVETATAALQNFVQVTHLPQPMLVGSGGGLHVYWPLTANIPATRWIEIAKSLKQLTQCTGTRLLADESRTADIASVLRPIGTRNWKPARNGAAVKLLVDAQPVDVDHFQSRIAAALDRGAQTSTNIGDRCPPGGLRAAIVGGLPPPGYSAPSTVHEGKRNAALLAYVGHLRRSGVPESVVLGIARDFNSTRCVPPLDETEVTQIVSRYEHQRTAAPSTLSRDAWPDPLDIKAALPPVPAFDFEMLPDVLKPAVADASELMQCPPDFLAVTYMVCATAALGLTISIAPKALDTGWLVPPVLWGAIVGRPGAKKSPAISKALRPIRLIEHDLVAQHEARMASYEAAKLQYDWACEQGKKAARQGVQTALPPKPQEPGPELLLLNDTTYQALGAALRWSPRGVLVQMDELTGTLKTLDTPGQEGARAFYLQAWNGNEAYRFNRIGRESFMIERLTICVLGGIQPDRLREYVGQAVHGGGGDDGLMQRFQLIVWPDLPSTWDNIDRLPDIQADLAVEQAFKHLRQLTPAAVGAAHTLNGAAYLQFAPDAQVRFDSAWTSFETLVRSQKLETALEAHFSKFPRMIAILALVIHLLDDGTGPVSLAATKKAVRWAIFLGHHAHRIYGSASSRTAASAHALANKISQGKLGTHFSARQVVRKGWRNLTSSNDAEAALDQLVERRWIAIEEATPDAAGRRSAVYTVNPKCLAQQ